MRFFAGHCFSIKQ